MVIVVMGEIAPDRDRIGGLLAESLGWEFVGVGSADRRTQTKSEPSDLGIPQMEVLSGVIHSSTHEWRDLIISCPTLPEKEQRQFRLQDPLIKFVHVCAPDRSDHAEFFVQPNHSGRFGASARQGATVQDNNSVLAVDSSQGAERILGEVLSELVLKPRLVNIRTA